MTDTPAERAECKIVLVVDEDGDFAVARHLDEDWNDVADQCRLTGIRSIHFINVHVPVPTDEPCAVVVIDETAQSVSAAAVDSAEAADMPAADGVVPV